MRVFWLILVALLASAPFWLDRGLLILGVEVLVIVSLAQAWNLLAGYGGLLSLGHHALFGVGGYALFVMTRDLPIHPYLAVPLAGLVTAAVALLLAPILLRLREVYFAVGMWVAAEIIRILVMRTEWMGSNNGLPLYAARTLDRDWIGSATFWLALALAVGTITLTGYLMAGRLGLRLRALRDDEMAARSIGIAPARVRMTVFLISAAVAGMAGSISFLSAMFITPLAAFDVTWMVTVVFVTVIGGIGRLSGPVFGAILYFALREMLAFSPGWYLVIMGATAIAVMLFAPGGIAGLVDRLLAAMRSRVAPGRKDATP